MLARYAIGIAILLFLASASFFVYQTVHAPEKEALIRVAKDTSIVELALTPQKVEEKHVRLVAVGDIMLSRMVDRRMHQYGYDYPFASSSELFANADIVFGNLETPITEGDPVAMTSMRFRADPEAVPALKRAGFTILSIANNHTPDYGEQGVLDTVTHLKNAGIAFAGAGATASDAYAPAYLFVEPYTFAFFAYNDSDVVPTTYKASEERAGTAFMDIPRMQKDVREAKETADFVIVSMHSGNEYEPTPNTRQTAFAHSAIDAGADVVIGHHPHVVQTMEVYKEKYIFYSLGNFIFDQMFSDETREGIVLGLTFGKDGVEDFDTTPVRIYDYAQPRVITETADIERIQNRLFLQNTSPTLL
jgi:poly-gamma-glutamate capsule biosynthesis protein CapA/YwtB (metallophosphatase superfamily)